MSMFLLVFFCLYGGTHLYFFAKAKLAFGFGLVTGVWLGVFLLAMLVAPIMVRVSEREGLECTARVLAYIGYIWMGFLFLFFSVSLGIDVYNLAAAFVSRLCQLNSALLQISVARAFFASSFAGVAFSLYGYTEALDIRSERVVVTSEKIPEWIGKLTIVQISDVHLGLIVRENRLQRIIDVIRKVQPDMVVSTGDLVDGEINQSPGLAPMLRAIAPRYGKFAITGNHEVYAGLDKALGFTEKAGFTVLRNTALEVGTSLVVAGVDDPAIQSSHGSQPDETTILAAVPRDRFVILLKHRPVVTKESLGLFDLQLSGHVHKGQIFPFNIITHLFYPVAVGCSEYPSGSFLYVSRGSGTWGPPMRIMAPPEVTIVELVHAGSRSSSSVGR